MHVIFPLEMISIDMRVGDSLIKARKSIGLLENLMLTCAKVMKVEYVGAYLELRCSRRVTTLVRMILESKTSEGSFQFLWANARSYLQQRVVLVL